jgi:hypothetical protein
MSSLIDSQGVVEDAPLRVGDAAIASDNAEGKRQDTGLASHQTNMQADDVIARCADNASSGSGAELGITSNEDVLTETVVSDAADNETAEVRDPRTGLVS